MSTPSRGALRRRRWRPPPHWLAFGAVLGGIVLALLVDGIAHNRVGAASTVARSGRPLGGLGGVGPIADFSSSTIRSAQPPANQVALTFDDGPDPRWTPQVLALLGRYRVPATFFVVGSKVTTHPGLVRAEVAAGDEVGSHTFTHAELGAVSGTRANLELSLTQVALAGAIGRSSSLLRLPYSSQPQALTASGYRAARAAGRYGYLVVFADRVTEDWRRPGAAVIAARAIPPPGQGAVILLHDGGGDRSQTLAALAQLVPALQARGVQLVTISQLLGRSAQASLAPVGTVQHAQGLALLWSVRSAHWLVVAVFALIVPLTLLVLARTVAVVVLAGRQARASGRRPMRPPPVEELPPVSAVVPAYNEEVGIAATVRSLLGSGLGDLEVVVVDDGSTDGTAAAVQAVADPRVRLIRQANAGKPAALNAGVAEATHDILVLLDGDTVFERDTLAWLVGPLRHPGVGAVCGNAKVGNRRRLLGRWQHVEYVLVHNLDRRAQDRLHCITTVPGAAGAFRRQALAAVGGVSDDTLAEDTDLTMALARAGWRVVYEERARAHTEAPAGLNDLWRQRYRWCYGSLQAMWKHRGAVGEGGRLGRVALPWLALFGVLLPLLSPVLDLVAVYALVFGRAREVLAIWLAYNVIQVALAAYALHLDGERTTDAWVVPLQQVVYRQLMYLVVIQSALSALAGTRLRWHKLARTGEVIVPPLAP
ncbi:MAG TPA: glycosyltransferase [Acidimicrobiales bacterium]